MPPELYAEFAAEAADHLEAIERWLLAPRSGESPGDEASALRNAHSIKGAARMIGASEIAEIAGQLEAAIAAIARSESGDSGAAARDALALCDRAMQALNAGTPATDSPGEAGGADNSSPWDDVKKTLPGLSELLVESLTDFQCAETLRLARQKLRFWLVYVESTAEAFEAASDGAVAWLRGQGHVIGQSVGVSDRDGFDYTVTLLFAGGEEPEARDDLPFHIRAEEVAVGEPPTGPEKAKSEPVHDEPTEPVEADVELQEVFLASADNIVQELTDSILAAERSPDSTEALDALFRAGHSLKGAGSSFGFPIVSRLGREMEQVLDRVRRRELAVDQGLLDVLYACADALGEIIAHAREGSLDQSAPLPVIESLQRLARGEPIGGAASPEPSAVPIGLSGPSLGHTIHLPVEAADRLLGFGRDAWLAAETASFIGPSEGELREAIDRTRSSILTVVDAILATRMQPVAQILRAYPRLVREVCRRQGKRVKLDIAGADVQMDRVLLEAINDPIVHLIRNALDHGIETAEERSRLGKPAEGTLSLHVSADRNAVTIEIRDDGRGIDAEALKRRAVRLGKLTRDEAAALTEAQALDLMFLPGVTTNETVTELSGRGVGMDVVRSNVEQVRGRIEVATKLGEGTTVRLHLPLTTAILRVLQVAVGEMPLCLPTSAVERVVSVAPGDREIELQTAAGTREVVPLVSARRYVAPEATGGVEEEAVILRDRGQALGLLVDRVEEERPVLVTDLGGLISRTKWVGACTLLASGEVAPILDTNALIEQFGKLDASETVPESQAVEPREPSYLPPTILVVDDSPTMLQLMRNVLELAGYRVQLAEDGPTALDALSDGLPDLVLCDVNMPTMDGLTLIREIRKRWSALPVAIVSGKDQESDRQAGLEAGAEAYIVKGATDRRGLLATVARLLDRGSP